MALVYVAAIGNTDVEVGLLAKIVRFARAGSIVFVTNIVGIGHAGININSTHTRETTTINTVAKTR